MPNFLQEKLEQFKQYQKEMKQRKFTRKDAAVGISAALVMVTAYGVSGFAPGLIHYPQQKDEKKVSLAEFSKLAGPQQTIEMGDPAPLKRKVQKPAPASATSTFGSLPSFATPFTSSGASSSGQGSSVSAALEKSKATFARHMELTDKMKSLLSSSFALKNVSRTPTTGNESRFNTSYEYANADGTVLEKFELMSVVKTPRMESIKTAQQALDALVEESQAIRVIETTDEYLIYDFAGDGGYQIGKIAVDDKGVYIFGYVNLTTSEMPEPLKNEWIEHYKSALQ